MCAGAGTCVSWRFSVNSSHHSGRSQTIVRVSMVIPLLLCCFEFLVNRASFLVRVRHFALVLDLKMYVTSPAVAMQRTNWYQNWTTIQGQQEVRNFRFCRAYLVWLGAAFDRWPLTGISVFFAGLSK